MLKKIKKDLKEAIENNDVKTIYKYFGIDVKEGKNGYLTISEYKQPSKDYTFKDLGIDENKLLEKVKRIEGDADFSNSQVANISKLKLVKHNVFIKNSPLTVEDFKNIKIGGQISTK